MQLLDETQSQKPREALVETLKQEYRRTEEELEMLKREIRFKNPLYSSVQYPEPISLREFQGRIVRNDEIILEYFISSRGNYCLVVTQGQFTIVKLPTDLDTLSTRVNDLISNIRGFLRGERFREETALQLYEDLIRPVSHLIGARTVVIVPHGVLAHLPFECLMEKTDGRVSYWVECHRIKYVQSASVLGILRTQVQKEGLSDRFIGFGDPVYDYENFRHGRPETGTPSRGLQEGGPSYRFVQRGYVRAGGQLQRLIGSGEEIKEIEKIFQSASKKGLTLLRIEAREEHARSKDLEEYGYIHFSTHGVLESRFQAIALSQIPDAPEDGFLTLGEIMNSRYNAHLVVLSACETGLGKMERGEGVTGLTRAVMYAGTPAAVVSLWSVSDEGTKELMIRFYQNLIRDRMGKESALRSAKIEMIGKDSDDFSGKKAGTDSVRGLRTTGPVKGAPYSHPFFWAAFVMYGE